MVDYLSIAQISKETGISHYVVRTYLCRPEFNIYQKKSSRVLKYYFTDTCKILLMNLYKAKINKRRAS